jgi:hypothetical protein
LLRFAVSEILFRKLFQPADTWARHATLRTDRAQLVAKGGEAKGLEGAQKLEQMGEAEKASDREASGEERTGLYAVLPEVLRLGMLMDSSAAGTVELEFAPPT